jgi:hypothetical protein
LVCGDSTDFGAAIVGRSTASIRVTAIQIVRHAAGRGATIVFYDHFTRFQIATVLVIGFTALCRTATIRGSAAGRCFATVRIIGRAAGDSAAPVIVDTPHILPGTYAGIALVVLCAIVTVVAPYSRGIVGPNFGVYTRVAVLTIIL